MARPVVLYDGDCRFCRFAARLVERLDRRRRLAFLPLDDPAAEPFLAGVSPHERFDSMRLAEPDGRLLAAGDALAELIAHLGAPGLRFLRRGYEIVARRRGLLGRIVPDGDGPRRFP